MNSRAEMAVSKFSEGYNCAQSVFYSHSDDLQSPTMHHNEGPTCWDATCPFSPLESRSSIG